MIEPQPRPYEHSDIPWIVGGLLLGAVVGMMVTSVLALIFEFGWIIVVLFSPFILFQLFFEGLHHAGIALWRKWRGKPPPPLKSQDASMPWQRRHSFPTGFTVGVLFIACSFWNNGGFF
jgi:hypothetical protein